MNKSLVVKLRYNTINVEQLNIILAASLERDLMLRNTFLILFLRNRDMTFHSNCLLCYGDNLKELSEPISGKNKKTMLSLSSAEFSQREVKLITYVTVRPGITDFLCIRTFSRHSANPSVGVKR